jgi:hypothetical protein
MEPTTNTLSESRDQILQEMRDAVAKFSAERTGVSVQLNRKRLAKAGLLPTRTQDEVHMRLTAEIDDLEKQRTAFDQSIAEIRAAIEDLQEDERICAAALMPETQRAPTSTVAPAPSAASAPSATSAPSAASAPSIASTSVISSPSAAATKDGDDAPAATAAASAPATGGQGLHVPRDMPKFRTSETSIQDAEDFLELFGTMLDLNGLSPDVHWRRLLKPCLKPSDAKWIARVPEGTTWEEACPLFLIQFGDPAKMFRLRDELVYARPGPKESPTDFCRRFQELATKAKVRADETIAAHLLLMRLPEELQISIADCERRKEIVEPTIDNITRKNVV